MMPLSRFSHLGCSLWSCEIITWVFDVDGIVRLAEGRLAGGMHSEGPKSKFGLIRKITSLKIGGIWVAVALGI